MADSKDDGEKLFSENNADVKSPEAAKFIPESENKNGISPINVDSVKTAFTGLTKEELMKYANDPFWVRIRWFLFVLFWVIWLLMLFGAVFIITITPKCQEPSPLSWWQKSPVYVIDVRKLVPENSPSETSVIEILKKKISYLKELGVESVLLKFVLESKQGVSDDEVNNFMNVDVTLESLDKFQNDIINYAKSKGINIILSFSPNYSGKNQMFIRSAEKEGEYKDFYVWDQGNYSSKPDKLPNNWLSVYDTPAWEWDEKRKQFYLHQFNVTQPDFNFRNSKVVGFISEVLKHWLNMGIKGFHLDKTEYLLENGEFKNETGLHTQYNMKQYGFYTHTQTYELLENIDIISNWSEVVRNRSGILSVSGGILHRRDIADLVLRPILLSPNFSATDIQNKISQWNQSVNYPTWEWRCAESNATCIPQSAVKGLTVISFLVYGTPVIKFAEEFATNVSDLVNHFSEDKFNMINKNASLDPQSHFNLIKKLIKMRSEIAFTFGDFESNVLNKTVYSFTRIKLGNPGYLVAWNIGNNRTVVNFKEHSSKIPKELTVELAVAPDSDSSFKETYERRNVVPSTKIEMPPMAAMVFSMVPNLK